MGRQRRAGRKKSCPLPPEPFKGKIGRTAAESAPDFPKGIEAPKGAPNVLLILTDDVGFGAPSTFGGPIPTPTFDKLAKAGLRYNTFHTTALCSPTRSALITGRNHHTNATGVDTDQCPPAIFDGTKPVEAPHDAKDYHFDADMADHAIAWIRQQNSLAPDKPSFAYYAPGLTHAPHHAPKEWITKFEGHFDQGWDKLREETFARQKRGDAESAMTKMATVTAERFRACTSGAEPPN